MDPFFASLKTIPSGHSLFATNDSGVLGGGFGLLLPTPLFGFGAESSGAWVGLLALRPSFISASTRGKGSLSRLRRIHL